MPFPFFNSRGIAFDASTDIPSLKDKVILVTGGNSGLGKQSILEFARHEPAKIFLAGRDLGKITAAIQDVKSEVPSAIIEPLELDLGSLQSVKAAARHFTTTSKRLDILLLNAGIMFAESDRPHTKDGYEPCFGTNHMGHALLTKLLLPTLLDTVRRDDVTDVRVVVVSSAGISWTPPEGINFAICKSNWNDISAGALYGQSKLANGLFAKELARRYPELTVACVHPGAVNTNLVCVLDPGAVCLISIQPTEFADHEVDRNVLADNYPVVHIIKPIAPFVLEPLYKGVRNHLWASVSRDVVSGEFYTPVGVLGNIKGIEKVRNAALAKELWEWTEDELKGQEL